MPGTDVPIIAPEDLLAADPDCVLLTLPDLLAEVSAAYPQLAGRWVSDDRFMTSEMANMPALQHLDREEYVYE